MKKIEAIVRPELFDEVRMHLSVHGFVCMHITDVKGRGRQGGIRRQWRGRQYMVEMISKIKICMVIPDSRVQEAIDAIVESAYTGETGDGKIFVSPVEKMITVRTGVVEQ